MARGLLLRVNMSQDEQQPLPVTPRVVVPATSKRDVITGIVLAVLVLGFVGFAVMNSSKPPRSNYLKGKIVEKTKTGEKEREIQLGFKQGQLDYKTTDSGYHFKIQVSGKPQPYVVPVDPEVWQSRSVGDSFEFIRPPSEQTY